MQADDDAGELDGLAEVAAVGDNGCGAALEVGLDPLAVGLAPAGAFEHPEATRIAKTKDAEVVDRSLIFRPPPPSTSPYGLVGERGAPEHDAGLMAGNAASTSCDPVHRYARPGGRRA